MFVRLPPGPRFNRFLKKTREVILVFLEGGGGWVLHSVLLDWLIFCCLKVILIIFAENELKIEKF